MKADYVHKDSKTSTNETISYKITMPLIDDEEIQRIDNHYNELVDKFIKQFVKEKDMIIAQRIMMNLRKENKLLLKENQKLKKQLETVRKKYEFESKNRDKIWKILMKKETQQKKFIEYLEDYIEVLKSQQENVNGLDILEEETLFILEETLEKYKEIIGGKYEGNKDL